MREVLIVLTEDGRALVDSPDGEMVAGLALLLGGPDECNPQPVVGDRVWCG
jgi:hypothetical protein